MDWAFQYSDTPSLAGGQEAAPMCEAVPGRTARSGPDQAPGTLRRDALTQSASGVTGPLVGSVGAIEPRGSRSVRRPPEGRRGGEGPGNGMVGKPAATSRVETLTHVVARPCRRGRSEAPPGSSNVACRNFGPTQRMRQQPG